MRSYLVSCKCPGSQFLLLLERDEPQNSTASGRIEGRVTDGGNGEVRDVDVSIVGEDGIRTLSNPRGLFAFPDVAPGLVQLRFTRIGYSPRTATLVVQAGRTSEVTAAMAPQAVELAPIEVTVHSAFLERNGYYDRLRQGQGRQLNRLELDRINPFQVSDVFPRLPGVRVQDTHVLGAPVVAFNPRVRTPTNGQCTLGVYIDGVEMSSPDLNQIPADWLDAMEIYLGSEAPIRYAGLNPCGVVLMWTRR